MFNFLGGLLGAATDFISGVGRLLGGTGTEDPFARLPVFDITFGDIFGTPGFGITDPGGSTPAEDILFTPTNTNVPVPPINQVTEGLEVFEGETVIIDIGGQSDFGLATFEPDPLVIASDLGTIETNNEEQEEMPIHGRLLGAAGSLIGTAIGGAAFGVGNILVDTFGSGNGIGTSTEVPEPLVDTGGLIGTFETSPGGVSAPGCNGNRGPTIAEIRGLILKSIGARHGRCSFSYATARRILRDLGEEAGARCLGITAEQACFLLIHPPKRRGRQITPKQINRAMGAYKRVKALNRSVRKTLGPGCKL